MEVSYLSIENHPSAGATIRCEALSETNFKFSNYWVVFSTGVRHSEKGYLSGTNALAF
jgi:hypothetical protein